MAGKELTSKQRAFARAWSSGLSLSAAYREAYDVSDSTSNKSVHNLASRLASKVEVRARYEHLLREKDRAVAASAVSRREKIFRFLDDVMDGKAEAEAQQMKAAELLAKASGMFVNDVRLDDKREASSEEIAGKIEALLLASEEEEHEVSPDEIH